jgi:pyruvate dehydrogenase E1 component alpha subunit
MYDPDRYRDKAEIDHWRERDPLSLLAAQLPPGPVTDESLVRLEAQVTQEIDDAVAFAEAGTDEPVADLTRFVTAAAQGR